MAFYVDEEEVWKCPKHPSKRRRSGICPICLRERLASLCPDCARVRPCACCTTSSSSSSTLPRFSTGGGGDADSSGVGSVGRVSNLIDSEPAFRRSRSVAIPFLRSRSRFVGNDLEDGRPPNPSNRSKSSFWSVFKSSKIKKPEETVAEVEETKKKEVGENEDLKRMMRSRSVGISLFSDSGGGGGGDSRSKGRGWYFPSPIKAFRQSKASKIVQERSPLYRG
ncbi:hypothetical protein CK203_082295 [Vitis vinifera]|uniref:Uncharacterized protein n=1 Tax=Vitis vinifera TaxID=29760 RepID=A0A438EQZ9_VITVI|nr:hypothetical protein CK203_082295 [Vitis vinifera]